MSGVDLQDNTKIRKGAFDAIRAYISEMNGKIPSDLETKVMEISNLGGTPLVVCKNEKNFRSNLSKGYSKTRT